jgi:hypothetical protein
VLKVFEPKTPDRPAHRYATRHGASARATSLSQLSIPAEIAVGQ